MPSLPRPWKRGLLLALTVSAATAAFAAPAWPEVTAEAKPWTRWWWPGSAVTPAELTAELEEFARVGLGGVEITPVYGAKGYEERWLDHLSPEWLAQLEHTLREAQRLGLGVDLAGGTGWNFGGPSVGDADAAKHVAYRQFTVPAGARLQEPVQAEQTPWVRFVLNQVYTLHGTNTLPGETSADPNAEPEFVQAVPVPDVSEIREPLAANPNLQQLAIDQIKFRRQLPLQTLMAYGPDGEVQELTSRVQADGTLDWTAPGGDGAWTLYAVFQAWNGKLVERAGPGGEGFMIDHFSPQATRRYLDQFAERIAPVDLGPLRAFFNDSYEVDDARHASDWTDDFFAEFRRRRGYDLRRHLPELFATDGSAAHRRVLTDYRETLSDLLLERFTFTWSGWAEAREKQIRNQAHGSPANILDLYAASDIPETEGVSLPHIKFASSAAHVSGRRLTSAEAVTFLNENFLSTPAQIRDNLRRYWLGGVNHVVYHGTAFSPADAPWPGWFFYVATHLNPRNPIWEHTAAVHHYAARVQSFLQAGQPDNDVLLYFPVHDRYAEPSERDLPGFEGDGPRRRLVTHFRTDGDTFRETSFGWLAETLIEHGYAVDYVSDRQLQTVANDGRSLVAADARYQTVVLPTTRYLPVGTFARLLDLAEGGATVILAGDLPKDVPGFADVAGRRRQLETLVASLEFQSTRTAGVRRAAHGAGQVLHGSDVQALLAFAEVRREPMVERGLQLIRRRENDDTIYYVINATNEPVAGAVALGTAGAGATWYDPMTGRSGVARVDAAASAHPAQVHLQIEPHGSRLVRLSPHASTESPSPILTSAGPAVPITGPWKLEFLRGGPQLPAPQTLEQLDSWTSLAADGATTFGGIARYTTRLARPHASAEAWTLDLGEVEETAHVRLNGRSLGIAIGPLYQVQVPGDSWRDENVLEIEVANLAANRIADLDRRGVPWKRMYNNNIRPLRAENRDQDGMFTAAHWEPQPSGLLGPVTLQPLRATP